MLLDNQLTDPAIVVRKFRELLLLSSDKYYLFVVSSRNMSGMALKASLYSILKQEVFVYKDYCVSILGFSILEDFSEQQFPKLLPFLEKNGLVSCRFFLKIGYIGEN